MVFYFFFGEGEGGDGGIVHLVLRTRVITTYVSGRERGESKGLQKIHEELNWLSKKMKKMKRLISIGTMPGLLLLPLMKSRKLL